MTRPKPTEGEYKAFEEGYGIAIPRTLRGLLEHSNGGHPELDSFLLLDSPTGERFAVNRFFHLQTGDESPDSFTYAIKHWRKIIGNKSLPFASDGGGNLFFLDTSKEPAPVMLCLHDEKMAIKQLAPNFESFIDGLETDPDMI